MTWHKISGIAVYSCPRPGSWNAVPSFCMFTASLVHLVPLSDSLSRIVDSDMLITWLSWLAWSVKADLFCSDKLDGRWLLVTGLLVVASTLSCVLSVLSQTSSQSHLCKSSHSYCTEFCTLSLTSSFSCLSFGCTSCFLKVLTGLIETGTRCFFIPRANLSGVPFT